MYKSGYTALSSGVTGATISYGATFAGPPASVVATIAYTGSTGHFILYPALTTKASTYCVFEFNGATDNSDYVLNWQASDANGQDTSVGSKPINRLEVVSSVTSNDHMVIYSTSGGASVTYRADLNTLKTFINS